MPPSSLPLTYYLLLGRHMYCLTVRVIWINSYQSHILQLWMATTPTLGVELIRGTMLLEKMFDSFHSLLR